MHVEAGVHGLERKQGFDQHAGAGEQDERRGDLRDGEDAEAAASAAGDAHAAVGETQAVAGFGGRQARNEGEQNRGDDRENSADPQHAGIDGEIERANREARSVVREDSDHRAGNDNAEQSSGGAHQQALGEQRAAKRAWAGAERGANREFTFAADAARKNQIGNVGARDHKDQQRRREQNEQDGFCSGRDLLFQMNG